MKRTFKDRILSCMEEKDIGALPHVLLHALSLLYGAAIRARLFFYSSGILKPKKLRCGVISVGNLTVGGSGKTPMTIYLAKRLREKGLKVAVVTRGYKRSGRGVKAVSDGERTLLGASASGDEPYLMARRLKGVPVIVGKDRFRAGLYAIEKFSPDVIILDDGFQHIRLKRDVNILLVDGKKGFGSGYLLPRGPLREPEECMERADVIMVKGGGRVNGPGINGVKKFGFFYRPTAFFDSTSIRKNLGMDFLKGKRVAALAGIADPGSFFDTLKECRAVVVKTIAYPDHHPYTPDDMKRIREQARDAEFIVTTEKDLVRLEPLCAAAAEDIPIVALAIEVEVKNADRFLDIVWKRLETARQR
ncbi:MAG: tetraacyldisaccharide 4'-kinase [Deltaproteobacteria bacterium]|nr:tetraacyldisaccharide 4'-kinase [Deltaproteobacteria bacterium]